MALVRLSYVSDSRVPGDPDDQRAAINDIASKAAAKNLRIGVTGVLMFNAGAFAQVLEGPPRVVGELFDQISDDDRHQIVSWQSADAGDWRMFERWSMGYSGTDTRWMHLFADLVSGGFDTSINSQTQISDMLFAHMLEAEPSLG